MTNINEPKNNSETFNRRDIHQQVTDTIIAQLEAGTVPWHQPWVGGGSQMPFLLPRNSSTGNKYRGVNILLLWAASHNQQFTSNEWASLKQWNAKKESIRAKEKGTMVVYYDTFEKEVDNEIKKIPFLKCSYVFNKCQLNSYVPEEKIEDPERTLLVERIDEVDCFIKNTKAEIEYHTGDAFYSNTKDKIFIPHQEMFIDTPTASATESFYAVQMHELMHWSGNPKRLNREKGKKYGDIVYAQEELIAELGAAFICCEMGITRPEKEDHAAYIASWLKVLKDNKNNIITAASAASKAVDYLQNLQPKV